MMHTPRSRNAPKRSMLCSTGAVFWKPNTIAVRPDLRIASISSTPPMRPIVGRRTELARLRAHKREDLLLATESRLAAIQVRVAAGRLKGADRIGLTVGKPSFARGALTLGTMPVAA